jgi:Immunity protein 52
MRFHLKISANFQYPRLEEIPSVEFQLQQMHELYTKVIDIAPELKVDWYLGQRTRKATFLNGAFDENGATTAIIAIAKNQTKKDIGMRYLGVWNGVDEAGGAGIVNYYSNGGTVSNTEFVCDSFEIFKNYKNVIRVVEAMVAIWNPVVVQVEVASNPRYQKAFTTRPGVNWMLYLPRVITTQQVPEARALVPIVDSADKKKQKGTVIVSVTDGYFDASKPELVEIVDSIDRRMVDQDLLPLYADFVQK